VVLVFVAIMMVIVSLLDIGFGTAVSWIFGGTGPKDS
jgi:preprotein translocase subunit SecE